MLNISHNNPVNLKGFKTFKSYKLLNNVDQHKLFNRFLLAFAVLCIVILFLPWTQNITGKGYITTLTPDQRPQTIQSPIPGRIEQWYVKEGQHVNKGDTILHISEIKNEYFDPNLVNRTDQQINSKTMSSASYNQKVNALETQIAALTQERTLKLEQARNKIIQSKLKAASDSIDYIAAQTNSQIALTQLDRAQTLNNEGLKPMTEVEAKRLKLQETQAKLISQENKWITSRNQIINAQIDLNRINQEYAEKIAKARSDQFTAKSSQYDVDAQVSKLQSDRVNYQMRSDMYYITAPQNGFINRAIIAGLGETFKEGQPLVNIMPSQYDLAVETYVHPVDMPLIHVGESVRVQFDGWPAIVFSGWPNVSFGTYGAKIVAIETFISDNGKYRILLAPDNKDHPWPPELSVGSGAYTIALLEDVPIWFELWRRLNGFPPNYYQPKTNTDAPKK